jgi:hypothetical protein
MQNLEEAIRERAYHLWMADGRPDGNSDAYWLNAQREILTTATEGPVSENPFSAEPEQVLLAANPEKKPKVARPRKSKRAAA